MSFFLRNNIRPLSCLTNSFKCWRSSSQFTKDFLKQSSITSRNVLREVSTKEYQHRTYKAQNQGIVDTLLYTSSVILVFVGFTYSSVPLYRMFCAATGIGGTPKTHDSKFDASNIKPLEGGRKFRITFISNISDSLNWSFVPQQREVYVVPGESSLAFFTAKNLAEEDIIGVSTYNVVPQQAGQYFNKIQCFCFEEQKLRAGEEVDMPVFFFIDPEIVDDLVLKDINTIALSYTFFKAK
ncbi:Cytochrome c oxidase assembly protein cox11, mitochondrial [Entomophthora muscae]|uniref:Cytochrome c oxidase assembly protein cox11, mitochondrial n=1 Tax=Entomophthora muscae TaxID=34485 RepID=A0ACC2RX40_9FUNG|nr:Cytochrome c oxidase assembly protein cox11, mitochondrial [Entomophthora muscae]